MVSQVRSQYWLQPMEQAGLQLFPISVDRFCCPRCGRTAVLHSLVPDRLQEGIIWEGEPLARLKDLQRLVVLGARDHSTEVHMRAIHAAFLLCCMCVALELDKSRNKRSPHFAACYWARTKLSLKLTMFHCLLLTKQSIEYGLECPHIAQCRT